MNIDGRGLAATLTFHTLVLLLLMFGYFATPLPLPSEQGILINFGDVKYASGPEEPRANVKKEVHEEVTQKTQVTATKPAEEKYMTQETEDAPSLSSSKKVEKVPVKKKETPIKVEEQPVKKVEKPEEKKPVVNVNALYKGRKDNSNYSGSEGVTQGQGNQGDPAGSENSTDRSLGFGSGGGISANLDGRNPVALPEPENNFQKEGKVVVQVKVDRSGHIVDAIPGVKGSTTLDSYLLSVAKKAALASRFDNSPDAPFYQTGTITYYFKLK